MSQKKKAPAECLIIHGRGSRAGMGDGDQPALPRLTPPSAEAQKKATAEAGLSLFLCDLDRLRRLRRRQASLVHDVVPDLLEGKEAKVVASLFKVGIAILRQEVADC